MPLKKSVETFNRREEHRRHLAELRIAYGNAISDLNLGRMRTRPVTYVPRDCSSCLPFGQLANSYSWQLSNAFKGKLTQKLTTASTSHVPDPNSISDEESTIFRRYDALQRQARLRSTFIKHLDQVRTGKMDNLTKSSIMQLAKFGVLN